MNPINNVVKAEPIDFLPDVKNVLGKIDKLESLCKSSKMYQIIFYGNNIK